MPSNLPRLFVKCPLRASAEVVLDRDQTHYLANVLRLKPDSYVLLFNGADGEWCARIDKLSKKWFKA